MVKEITLRLLSLNCWGIPYISKNRADRMEAIAEEICNGRYNIVCLQEIWLVSDYKMIAVKAQEKLPHSHYFYSGVVGSGICIFSEYPIQDVMFHKWSLNGYVHKIHHGDWFGGKGVGLCRLKVNDANINVYIAHLHAEYNTNCDEYHAHRILQAFDMAQFIKITGQGAHASILGGDLNTGPQDLAYKIIRGVASLTDACSNEFNDTGTSESAMNSYTPPHVANIMPQGKRIDHIMYLDSKNITIEVESFALPLPQRVPKKNFSYSDHEAVSAILKLKTGEYEESNIRVGSTKYENKNFGKISSKLLGEYDESCINVESSLNEALSICDESLRCVRRQRIWYLLSFCLLIVPLTWSMGVESGTRSVVVNIGLNIVRLFGTALLCYVLFMGTIWNCVEQNALKAGYLGMKIYLIRLNNSFEAEKL